MKILVTGGAGFIGSHVSDTYVKAGHEVTVLDSLVTGDRRNINPRVRFVEMDIRDREGVAALFDAERFEIVNHHAAQMDVRKSVDDPMYDADVNVLGSLNLLVNAIRCGARKFIYISTGGAVYGEPESLPVTESDLVNPECPYGITKHTVEHYLYLYKILEGLDYTVLRYPNVYGPRQSPKGEAGVVAIFAGLMLDGKTPTLYGNGEPTRDYVYVGDVAAANQLALTGGGGEILNLGSNKGTSVRELFDILAGRLDFTAEPKLAPLRPGEINHIHLSGDKAGEVLGWQPGVTVEEGLAATADWIARVKQAGEWR